MKLKITLLSFILLMGLGLQTSSSYGQQGQTPPISSEDPIKAAVEQQTPFMEQVKKAAEAAKTDASIAWYAPVFFNGFYPPLMMDVNGDGRIDMVAPTTSEQARVYINKGDGTWDNSRIITYWSSQADFYHFPDLNGDGLPDFVRIQVSDAVVSASISLSNGTDWVSVGASPNWAMPAQWNNGSYMSGWYSYYKGIRFQDINGDGLTDLLLSYYDGNTSPWRTVVETWLNTGTSWQQVYQYHGQ